MYKNILVINLLHIGDLLMATPLLRTLRFNYPDARITLLADAKIDGMVRFNQHIDELISVDKKGYHNKLGNYLKLIADIRRRNFDLVVNLHPNERSSALAAFSGGKKIVGYSSPGLGILFDHLVKNRNFDPKSKNSPDIIHQAREHLRMLEKTLGITKVDDAGLEMWLDQETEDSARLLWCAEFGTQPFPVVGFNTGASWTTKRWTAEGFAAVGDQLLERGYGIAFFGGPMDRESVQEILALMKHSDHPRVAIFTGRVTLLELAGLIRKCAVFLTNDSGPMHVAVAQKAPVVAIFGPSNVVSFAPYDKRAIIVTAPDITCRPCGIHQCDHHSCMKGIKPEVVLDHILALAGKISLLPRPAVFFDRDGVLNIDKEYLCRSEDFEWLPGAVDAIRFFNDRGFYTFVVSNQSGVARGYYKEQDVRVLHNWMNRELAKQGAHIDAFYYCPHHPTAGELPYRRDCNCRKPAPGLIMDALGEWNVDRENSRLIGDRGSDIAAAEAAGIKGYLFRTDEQSLLEFVKEKMRSD